MIKRVFIFLIFFTSFNFWGQDKATLTVAVDSTVIKIGEQLNYILQVKADSLSQVVFPESPLFAPFELLEDSPIDTIREESHYLYTKKYALILFDSGNYFLPQQQVLINGFSKIAELIPIRVNSVVVDTTKQKLYDIKPIQEVEKNYDAIIAKILWGLFFTFALFGILYTYLFQKRRKEIREKEILPFDRAIEELKALENESLSEQEEFKVFYSRLTDIVRRYLEDEAKIDALESTSEELLIKLEMRKDAGTLNLDQKTLMSLREVLQNADLVKFAKSMPEYHIANDDRKLVENVVIQTKEALPEPTEEELKNQVAYREYLAKKRRKEQWIWGLSGIGISSLLILVTSMLVYGYYPVRDTLLAYPTKSLLSAEWVMSQYGTPPLKIETPQVLERIAKKEKGIKQFNFGTLESPFYIDLLFDFPLINSKNPKIPSSKVKEDDLKKGQVLVNSIISNFESKGAVNILIKNDEIEIPSGSPASRVFGTLDYPKDGDSEKVRCSFNSLLLTFEEGTIILTMMYEKDDRYASKIEQRIINSLELINEL